jgi:acyl-CoA thioesterase-1
MLAIAHLSVSAYGQENTLPRVLIIGDAVSAQPAREVTNQFKGRAEVVYAAWEPGEIANTITALKNFDRLLGHLDKNGEHLAPENRPNWDLIVFNFGLGDLIYRAPNMQSFRVMPIHVGGVRTTPPDRYEQNLHELAKRLKATGAKVVWASTTPIRASSPNVFERGSEIEYNTIASKVMAAHDVRVLDMYRHAKSLIDMDKPAPHSFDPFFFDNKPIHQPMVDLLIEELNLAVEEAR